MSAAWYLRRLRRMSTREVAVRGAVAARQWWWSAPRRRPNPQAALLPGARTATVALHRGTAPRGAAADAVVQAADGLLRDEWQVFGRPMRTVSPAALPDWFHDPLTGRDAPQQGYCFRVRYRDEAEVGNIKFVWELSRHQPTTLLACAWWLSGEERFAEGAASHLSSWWSQNPFLHGVHWVSGIEVGLRLLAWTWIRALLADWPGSPGLFEQNGVFVRQLHAHSCYLSAFRSTGSSANNHLIAEQAGLFAAATAFPWFRDSADWAAAGRSGLTREAEAQTHADGWNREQASGYHLFVAEMLLAAALPARMAGQPLPEVETVLSRMIDALAASLDGTAQPPRFGDADDARGLLLDAPQSGATAPLLDAGRALFGADPWWPAASGSVLGSIAGSLAPAKPRSRPCMRPSMFAESGIAILRSGDLWLRCDAGPHGYRSIAAHGHADALSIELRCGGTEIVADPGTYCYHGEPAWRRYFRGTQAHSTLALGGADQAVAGGPFLWLTQPRSVLEEWHPGRAWQARHDGYAPVIHHRRVELAGRTVTVQDWIDAEAPHPVSLAFHLGPSVQVSDRMRLDEMRLAWPGGSALATLPVSLAWRAHRGEEDPPFGWYSRGFGQREPATVLAGRGTLAPGAVLTTCFTLAEGQSP